MIDLQKFCNADDIRSHCTAPFVLDGYRYATNQHIIVRVPAAGEPDTDDVVISSSVRKLFAQEYDPAGFVPLPALPAPQKCLACQGTGRIDCDDDDPDPQCLACWGTGFRSDPIPIRQAYFAERYLRLMHDELPNVRIHPRGPADMAGIVFDGGEGRLMPCKGA